MKKLPFDSSDWKKIGTINDLIDLVNSQQEAIEKLEKVITRETVRIATDEIIEELSGDTYRTVTLHIPRDKTIAEAVTQACGFSKHGYFLPTDKKLVDLLKNNGGKE